MERAWTQRMRTRLTSAALAFGMREDEFSASHWSGISFRKGSLTALAYADLMRARAASIPQMVIQIIGGCDFSCRSLTSHVDRRLGLV
eukprot:COSAG01_NODE_6158_length_3819_cov_76.902151_2_plen_88_part_00